MQMAISALERDKSGKRQREFQGERGDSNLNKMVREDLTENKDKAS